MESAQPVKAPEVTHVYRQYLPDTVYIHAGRQPCVMELDALDVMSDRQRTPALMHLAAIRQKLEIPLDHTRDAVRLRDGQAEAVLVAEGGSTRSRIPQGFARS